MPSPEDERRYRTRPPTTVTEQGEVLTQADLERRILLMSDGLEQLIYDLAAKAEAAAQAEVDYKVSYAQQRAMARTQGGSGPSGRCTNDEADDWAIRACEAEFEAYKLAESIYQATREAMRARQAQLDALRTLCANLRVVT